MKSNEIKSDAESLKQIHDFVHVGQANSNAILDIDSENVDVSLHSEPESDPESIPEPMPSKLKTEPKAIKLCRVADNFYDEDGYMYSNNNVSDNTLYLRCKTS